MTHTTLQGALEALYGLERRKDKLGLEGTRALLAALGNPERRFRAVHVAGTNGKGTTCALIERALREAGYRTGLFTSPHLVDFRERIRVNGRWADEAWLFEKLEHIQSLPEGKDRTFFEVVTALGFLYFAEQGVEWAIVEVGLGGRLDTTNVITPEVSVITSIGLDHTEILGDTIEKIAFEKAGIIKPGVPVVVGDVRAEALAVIEGIARDRRSSICVHEPPVEGRPAHIMGQILRWGLTALKIDNGRVAWRTLDALRTAGVLIDDEIIGRAFKAARWPGRFQPSQREPRLWWDGAHNEHAARRLSAAARRFECMVLAMSRDKDVGAFLGAIESLAKLRRLIATRSRSERALDPETIVRTARERGWESEVVEGVVPACRRALAATDGRVLLTGSLFAVGEAMEAFGGAPGEQL